MPPTAPKPQYPCTACGGDATIAYTAGKKKGRDWSGKVKKGERICTRCYKARGGKTVF